MLVEGGRMVSSGGMGGEGVNARDYVAGLMVQQREAVQLREAEEMEIRERERRERERDRERELGRERGSEGGREVRGFWGGGGER